MGYEDRHGAVQGHGVVQLVLEHIQVIKPIWVTPTEESHGESNTLTIHEPGLFSLACSRTAKHLLCAFQLECVCVLGNAVNVFHARKREV